MKHIKSVGNLPIKEDKTFNGFWLHNNKIGRYLKVLNARCLSCDRTIAYKEWFLICEVYDPSNKYSSLQVLSSDHASKYYTKVHYNKSKIIDLLEQLTTEIELHQSELRS